MAGPVPGHEVHDAWMLPTGELLAQRSFAGGMAGVTGFFIRTVQMIVGVLMDKWGAA